MGCIGSKAAVVPEASAGAAPVLQQQADDSTKPWKKNQVVPAPVSAFVEGASRQQQQPKPSAAFAVVGKDTKQLADQGDADVLRDLKRVCSERVDGARLVTLAERLYEALQQQLSGALRSASSPKGVAAVLELVNRAVACCNAILQPVLAHINRVLSNKQAGSSWSVSTSWEQVEFSDFLGVLEDACNATYDQGVMEVGRPVAALMELIYELRQHCFASKIQIPETTTQVPALNELMAMLGIIFFRKVVLETSESAASKLDQVQQLQDQIGWSDAQLGCCTGPEARATLMYLHQVSAGGERRTNVMVRRCAAFWDAFENARKNALLPASTGPVSHKYFPLFLDEFTSHHDTHQGALGGRKPAVEAGEGHGPRKEFFILAGQDMAGLRPTQQQQQQQQQPSEQDGKQQGQGQQQQQQPGRQHGQAGSGDGKSSRPESAASQRTSRPPLWVFNRTAGAFWYNTTLTDSSELRGAYAFAGWLMGQSLLNRAPLGLRLPPVLFQALLEGPAAGGDATATATVTATAGNTTSSSGAAAAAGGGGANSGGRASGDGFGGSVTGGFQPTLDMLAAFDPDAASGVRNVASLPPDQLRGMLDLEGLPADWSAERYTQHAVATVLRDGVAWQATSVAAGFFAALDRRLLRTWQLRPAALSALIAGGAGGGAGGGEVPADLSSLFRLAVDEELSGSSAVLVQMLWQVLAGWPAERRLRFVEFVTGTSRLPLPGSELLKIQAPFVAMGASEHSATLGMLPQAHTCDNLLELPNYWESLLAVRGVRGGPAAVTRGSASLTETQLAELKEEARRILDDRLSFAVMNFQGYGLDERSGGGGGGGRTAGVGGGDGGGGDNELGTSTLSGPEPSPEPELTVKPVALTADSLASLARLSANSSNLLHSSHPLAFSTAGLGARTGVIGGGASPQPGQTGPILVAGNTPVAGLVTVSGVAGSNPPGGETAAASVHLSAGQQQQPLQQLRLNHNQVGEGRVVLKRVMTDAERQEALLARFDIGIDEKGEALGKGGMGGAGRRLAPTYVKQASSSTEESTDAFK